MEELTAKLHRMGDLVIPRQRIVTPEYHEPAAEVLKYPPYYTGESQMPHQAFPQGKPKEIPAVKSVIMVIPRR